MCRFLNRIVLTLAIAGVVNRAAAFALLGPLDTTYQNAAIGYNPLGFDSGGPMNLGEEYRWNMPVIYYAFDPSFVNYFGNQGVAEVNKAMAILNDLRPMSALSDSLSEFPNDTRRFNYTASALLLVDLKSVALSTLMEELGPASPERYVWTLRDRRPIAGSTNMAYIVIMRNFDPVTYAPSPYVNGSLYTYAIIDPVPVAPGATAYADAEEFPLDPLDLGFSAVASAVDDTVSGFRYAAGEFFTGLTRDDVGSLRYLYAGVGKRANRNVETLPAGATNSAASSPWGISSGSSVTAGTALRPGVNKLLFRQAQFDSTFGFFVAVTNVYADRFVTNNRVVTQRVSRTIVQPDIVFSAADLPLTANGAVQLLARTLATGWINNAALNTLAGGGGPTAGPGTIPPLVAIIFNKLGPFFQNSQPTSQTQETSTPGFLWGSFDGTTNPPILYPVGTSIQDRILQVFSGQ